MCVAALAAIPAWVSTAATVAGTAFSMYSAMQQGEQAQATANYNAKMAEESAKAKESAATDAVIRGGLAEDQQRQRTRSYIASQRASMAANGGDLTDQSSVNILSDTAATGELDALTLRSNAAKEAWGIRVGAANDTSQAAAYRISGENAYNNGIAGAIGAGIGGVTKVLKIK